MKLIKYLLVGIVFGITLSKAEIVSWYRIYEMFRFQSFHMYGVIGSAVVLGIIAFQLIERLPVKTLKGENITIKPKEAGFIRNMVGGILFGMGWVITGACPGPLFILVGNGFTVIIVVIASALLGTYVYGLLRSKLPH